MNARLGGIVLALGALASSCASSSRLEPSAPLASLESGARAQLCRFTVDLLADSFPSCRDTPPADTLRDFDACVARPPWACGAADETVETWEACVNGWSEDICAADLPCVLDDVCP